MVLSDIHIFGYWTMIAFLAILTVGLIYEWMKGGLEWE
jgi:NADH:ubiquinone oxidoreductase subunit 3 (subunit A)